MIDQHPDVYVVLEIASKTLPESDSKPGSKELAEDALAKILDLLDYQKFDESFGDSYTEMMVAESSLPGADDIHTWQGMSVVGQFMMELERLTSVGVEYNVSIDDSPYVRGQVIESRRYLDKPRSRAWSVSNGIVLTQDQYEMILGYSVESYFTDLPWS